MAIVSVKYRFIFIKTMKTAGTSLEVHLMAAILRPLQLPVALLSPPEPPL
jgi:hypothetical protein